MQARNRELGGSIESIEASASAQQDRCELQRQEHNKQNKLLFECKSQIRSAKQEYKVLIDQLRKVKEEIARADNSVFLQHRHLHHIDKERRESDSKAYARQGAELHSKKAKLATDISQLCREIESEDKRKEGLRKQLVVLFGDKDIVVSSMCATVHLFIKPKNSLHIALFAAGGTIGCHSN
jgi:chromosome segregation ATPase